MRARRTHYRSSFLHPRSLRHTSQHVNLHLQTLQKLWIFSCGDGSILQWFNTQGVALKNPDEWGLWLHSVIGQRVRGVWYNGNQPTLIVVHRRKTPSKSGCRSANASPPYSSASPRPRAQSMNLDRIWCQCSFQLFRATYARRRTRFQRWSLTHVYH